MRHSTPYLTEQDKNASYDDGGSLTHLLLVVAVILLVFNLVTGRGARI